MPLHASDTVPAQEDGLRPWKCGQRILGAWLSGVRSELLAWAAEWTGPLLGTGSWEKGRGSWGEGDAESELGFKAEKTLDEMCKSSYEFQKNNKK